jgi:hypothetical protein
VKIESLEKTLEALRIGQHVNLIFAAGSQSIRGLAHLLGQHKSRRVQMLNLSEEGAGVLLSLGEWGEGSRNVKICFTYLSLPEDRVRLANALADHLSSASPVTMPDQHLKLVCQGDVWMLEMTGGTTEARDALGKWLGEAWEVDVELGPKHSGAVSYRLVGLHGDDDELAFSERIAETFGLKLEMP